MANRTVSTTQTTGQTLYAYPDGVSLAGWAASRVAITEQAAPNLGRYYGVLDDSIATLWRLFIGATQPSSWDEAVEVFQLSSVTGIDTVTVVSPVDTDSNITAPIIIGDDYLAANDRAFEWTIPEVTGFVAATCTCTFGGSYKTYSWLVNGTVTDNGDDTWTLSFDMTKTTTAALAAGHYVWSVEVKYSGTEVTRVRSGRTVQVVAKQT